MRNGGKPTSPRAQDDRTGKARLTDGFGQSEKFANFLLPPPLCRVRANGRFPRPPLRRIECSHGIVEFKDGADAHPQPSMPNCWMTSPTWAGSASTTKSTAKPSEGRVSIPTTAAGRFPLNRDGTEQTFG